jgi:hypothetical protein
MEKGGCGAGARGDGGVVAGTAGGAGGGATTACVTVGRSRASMVPRRPENHVPMCERGLSVWRKLDFFGSHQVGGLEVRDL